MNLQRMEHVGIMVSDLDRSVAWYTQVLGLELRHRIRLNENTELAFLVAGGCEIELVHKTGPFTSPKDGIVNHVCFRVADIEGALAHLKGRGVELLNTEPVAVPALKGRIAFFLGPDGEKLELFCPQ